MSLNQQQSKQIQSLRLIRTAFIGDVPSEKIEDGFRLNIHKYGDLGLFLKESFSDREPELIVLFQGFSDQYSPSEIDQLFEKHPLSRILVAYGPCCESDGRTRHLWPQTVRVPLWRLPQRIEREVDVLTGNSPALPVTATREETIHFENGPFANFPSGAAHSSEVIIFSPDTIWAEMISSVLASANYPSCRTMRTLGEIGSTWQEDSDDCRQIIFDIDPFNQTIKGWFFEHLINSGKNYTADSDQNQLPLSSSVSHIKPVNAIPKQEPNSCKGLIRSEQIVAVTNWLTPHCCKELEQFGISRRACKLNLPGILAALSQEMPGTKISD